MKKNETKGNNVGNAHREDIIFDLYVEGDKITKEILDAMINALPESRDPNNDFTDTWIQDLRAYESKNNICTMMSMLSRYDFMRYIPAMVKGLAEAMPTMSFSGSAIYDGLLFFADEHEFRYENGALTINSYFSNDELYDAELIRSY